MKFKQDVKTFLSSKTNWMGVSGVIGAVVGFYAGQLDIVQAVQSGMVALGFIFVKDAIAGKNQ